MTNPSRLVSACDDLLEWCDERASVAIVVLFGAVGLLFLAIIPVVIFHAASPSFMLKKADWVCTQSRLVTSQVMVGKIFVPQTVNECIQWTHK